MTDLRAHRTVTVSIEVGDTADTGETCPTCGFDCVQAVVALVRIGGRPADPSVHWFCGRDCGRIKGDGDAHV